MRVINSRPACWILFPDLQTVQLSRKEQAAQDKAKAELQEKVQELAAEVSSEKEKQLERVGQLLARPACPACLLPCVLSPTVKHSQESAPASTSGFAYQHLTPVDQALHLDLPHQSHP